MKEKSDSPSKKEIEKEEEASSPSKSSNIFSIEEEEKHLRKMKKMLLVHRNAQMGRLINSN